MTEDDSKLADQAYLFGAFRLIPAQQLLLEDGVPVRLGSRALQILTALVEKSGELIPKHELMARAWPRTVVEESNLKVTIAALRRALGDGRLGHRYLINIPGRGYQFVAQVRRGTVSEVAPAPLSASQHNLPHRATRMVGRDDVVAAIAALLPERRFISIVGAAGIGKTTVAVAIAEAIGDDLEHGAHFIDLAPLLDGQFLPQAIAKTLGVRAHSGDTVAALLAAVRDRRLLLILDSCEHVLEATAALVEQVLSVAPGVMVLATTREPVRMRGETVHRLAALPAPPRSAGLTAGQALTFPAVELFVERASACLEGFNLSDKEAPIVAEICRKLEGVALAIELTATRVDAFTLRELSALLEDRFRLLSLDRRGASPRHRSLAAALDWSHDLLLEEERRVLRRLSVFSGTFSLASGEALTGADSDVPAALESLVAKSLVSADVGGTVVRYRLLDTMRAYAAHKLSESGELADVRRQHGEHLLDVLALAEAESPRRLSADWAAEYGRWMDDLRGALDWAFSPEGSVDLGIALTIASLPLWNQLSLLEECRLNVERALACERPGPSLGRSGRMKLCAALGSALLYTKGPQAATERHLKEALAIADEIHDVDYQLRMLWAIPVYLVFTGDYRAALGYLRRLRTVARQHGDAADLLSADRLIATAFHYFGRHASARSRLEQTLPHYLTPLQQSHISRFQFDQRSAARGTLANVLWIQGYPEQARRMARLALEDAEDSEHPLSLSSTLGNTTFPIALYTGDIAAADLGIDRLREHIRKNALQLWPARTDFLEGMLKIERGDLSGADQMATSLVQLREAGFHLRRSYCLCGLARGMAAAGRNTEARAAIEEALTWCEQTGERWFLPEAMRLKGDLLRVKGGGPSRRQAERMYREAMALAHTQRALAWELRCATSLAGLLVEGTRHEEAVALLEPVILRFTEGFATRDLQVASRLLDRLRIAKAA